MLLGLKRISTAFGVLALGTSVASAQAPLPVSMPAPVANSNQATANAVAAALKASPMSAYRIEIETKAGVVTLSGLVANAGQKRDAVALVGRVAGVTGVVDQIGVKDARVRPVQYQVAMNGGHFGHHGNGGMVDGGTVVDGGAMTSAPMTMSAPDGSPLPEGPAGPGAAIGSANPPNYAWPSYAPTGNFSAVGYPTAYPWQAWPNIGPFYPYPEVPQDWRAVTLRWDDGIWWLDFKKNYTRPFFTPYPFGLFAY